MQSRLLATTMEKKDITHENIRAKQEGEHNQAMATDVPSLTPTQFEKSSKMKTVKRTTKYMLPLLQEKLDDPEDLLDPTIRTREKKGLLAEQPHLHQGTYNSKMKLNRSLKQLMMKCKKLCPQRSKRKRRSMRSISSTR